MEQPWTCVAAKGIVRCAGVMAPAGRLPISSTSSHLIPASIAMCISAKRAFLLLHRNWTLPNRAMNQLRGKCLLEVTPSLKGQGGSTCIRPKRYNLPPVDPFLKRDVLNGRCHLARPHA